MNEAPAGEGTSAAAGQPQGRMLAVAIVGRPNVGKSTLFNRLVGQRMAIVDDMPGVTRDRRVARGRIADLEFTVIDTAGLEDAPLGITASAMQAQTEAAVSGADVVMLIVDARAGVTPLDEHFALALRKTGKPLVLLANKAEGRTGMAGAFDAFVLGLGDPIAISAEHGDGLADVYTALREEADRLGLDEAEVVDDGILPTDPDELEDEVEPHALQLAIVGRPNVGKSTLLNRILGEERVVTGPEPGVTRDAIRVEWSWNGRPVRLIDTAGMRRRMRVQEKIEQASVKDSERAIRFAHVAALVIDGTQLLERQDLTIARRVIDEGRALVIVVNKWDLVENREAAMADLRDRLEMSLAQVKGVPVVTLSALTGQRIDRLMPAVAGAYEAWNRRVSTGELNRWLRVQLEAHPPPLVSGRRIKIRYMTQIKRRPPTFALFASQADEMPESYLRYLSNGLRQDFDMPGTPIRMLVRRGRNPYADAD